MDEYKTSAYGYLLKNKYYKSKLNENIIKIKECALEKLLVQSAYELLEIQSFEKNIFSDKNTKLYLTPNILKNLKKAEFSLSRVSLAGNYYDKNLKSNRYTIFNRFNRNKWSDAKINDKTNDLINKIKRRQTDLIYKINLNFDLFKLVPMPFEFVDVPLVKFNKENINPIYYHFNQNKNKSIKDTIKKIAQILEEKESVIREHIRVLIGDELIADTVKYILKYKTKELQEIYQSNISNECEAYESFLVTISNVLPNNISHILLEDNKNDSFLNIHSYAVVLKDIATNNFWGFYQNLEDEEDFLSEVNTYEKFIEHADIFFDKLNKELETNKNLLNNYVFNNLIKEIGEKAMSIICSHSLESFAFISPYAKELKIMCELSTPYLIQKNDEYFNQDYKSFRIIKKIEAMLSLQKNLNEIESKFDDLIFSVTREKTPLLRSDFLIKNDGKVNINLPYRKAIEQNIYYLFKDEKIIFENKMDIAYINIENMKKTLNKIFESDNFFKYYGFNAGILNNKLYVTSNKGLDFLKENIDFVVFLIVEIKNLINDSVASIYQKELKPFEKDFEVLKVHINQIKKNEYENIEKEKMTQSLDVIFNCIRNIDYINKTKYVIMNDDYTESPFLDNESDEYKGFINRLKEKRLQIKVDSLNINENNNNKVIKVKRKI